MDQPSAFSASQITSVQELGGLGLRDPDDGIQQLDSILRTGIPVELFKRFVEHLKSRLVQLPDPDRAVSNLARFAQAAINPLSLISLVERDEKAVNTLLQLFGTSQVLSQLLIRDPEAFDLIRMTDGQPVSREFITGEIASEINALSDRMSHLRALRLHKQREILRIGYGHVIGRQPVPVVTEQLSYLADAIAQAALGVAGNIVRNRYGVPRNNDGTETQLAIFGLGRWGGLELSYFTKIQPVFFYEHEGHTDGRKSVSNHEYFTRLAKEFLLLLTEPVDLDVVYEVGQYNRAAGQDGPVVMSADRALHYYDNQGRTWERQLYVKARCVAGDQRLGQEFLSQMLRWVYRRYLSRADITELKALKRRIEHRAKTLDQDDANLVTLGGDLVDIEFAVQFLQLLNGARLESVQTVNTLDAIEKLAAAECLTPNEAETLQAGYSFLSQNQLYAQILFETPVAGVSNDQTQLRLLSRCMGFSDGGASHQAFRDRCQKITDSNRDTLNHLLHDAFSQDEAAEPAVDLVLDPSPTEETVRSVLAPFGFENVSMAYENLSGLGNEQIPFLSTRRCRHFLAGIAPTLLQSVKQTPNPDATLTNLASVSDSLGGKGVLWELFSFSPPTLDLYVRLCASSPYLSSILTSNPGMLDDLMDSLVRNKLPSRTNLKNTLAELVRNAQDLDPILHNFKSAQHLFVGVRDILGKEDIQETTCFLADVAELCLQMVTEDEYRKLAEKYGTPFDQSGDKKTELIVVATGKLGAREPNYHSNFHLIFLYDSPGATKSHARGKSTSNQHFFHELAQRIVRRVNYMGPFGALFDVDVDRSLSAASGRLAISADEFEGFFRQSKQISNLLNLCKGRAIFGSQDGRQRIERLRQQFICDANLSDARLDEIYCLRQSLEKNASPNNLKRSPGGTLDIEFIVQALQLRFGRDDPAILVPGTIDGLRSLRDAGYLPQGQAEPLIGAYRYLRSVEARLRLMNTTARHDLPTNDAELAKLAFLLQIDDVKKLQSQFADQLKRTRETFEAVFKKFN